MKSFFFSRLSLKIRGRTEEFKVESKRSFKDFYIIKLRGIDSISEAKKFVGSEVLIREESLVHLEEGEFSSHQIRGISVETEEGIKLGLIKDIMPAGESEILIMEYKGREVLIPFVQKICREIDIEEKRIIVDLPKGILDLNEI